MEIKFNARKSMAWHGMERKCMAWNDMERKDMDQ
jgi:hypothetical protein